MWDYQTKACVHTLEGHAHNISAVAFHPELPVILTASEDGCIKMWHATTYRYVACVNRELILSSDISSDKSSEGDLCALVGGSVLPVVAHVEVADGEAEM